MISKQYIISITDSRGNPVTTIPIGGDKGYVFPFTTAGAEELNAEVERAIAQHEAHLDTVRMQEVPI
tara:strand:+ start:1080 stop:1280 length:201 start_codon:yes stop_codon:yes gene_type:complete